MPWTSLTAGGEPRSFLALGVELLNANEAGIPSSRTRRIVERRAASGSYCKGALALKIGE